MVVNELLQTEKDYIKDLQMCVEEIIEPLQKKQVKHNKSSRKAAELSYISLKPFPAFLNQRKPKYFHINVFFSAFPSAEEC